MRTFVALGYRDYRFLWLSTACANSGRWAFTVGVSWLVFSLSHSSALMGLTMFASMVPAVICNPFVGVLADRIDRRVLLSMALFLSALGTGILAILTVLHLTTVWMVLVCAFLVGIALSVQMTSSNAMLPNLVPKSMLFNAAALQGTVNQGSEFMGSALATPLLATLGPAAVFGLCFLLYAGAAGLSLVIHAPDMQVGVEAFQFRYIFRPMVEGVRYISRTKPLSTLTIVVGLHCALTMAYTVLLPEFAQQSLQGGKATYGTLMTVVGLGAIVGTIATAALTRKRGLGGLYAVTAVVSGAALFGLGNVHSPMLAYIAGFFIGSSQAVFMAVSLSFMMQPTEDRFRGRVSSVYSLMAAGFMAVATYGYGLLGTALAPKIIMLITGGLFPLLFLAGVVMSSELRSICRGDSASDGGGDVTATPMLEIVQSHEA